MSALGRKRTLTGMLQLLGFSGGASAWIATVTRLISSWQSIRSALARRFLLNIKRATHRARAMPFVPEANEVLVLAPHMDDEVIGCGGTLLRMIEAGAGVHVLYASDSSGDLRGARGATLSAVRREEAQKVREHMGFLSTEELGFPDGHLHQHEAALANSILGEIKRLQPDLLFCPFPADGHSDHMATAAAVSMAAREWGGTILAYEVWTALIPNVVVDISAFADRKARAIRLYKSQCAAFDFEAAALGLNAWRGMPHGFTHGEAFYRATPKAFGQITALLDL